jgi:lipid A ethanolaminephosphotransferase
VRLLTLLVSAAVLVGIAFAAYQDFASCSATTASCAIT